MQIPHQIHYFCIFPPKMCIQINDLWNQFIIISKIREMQATLTWQLSSKYIEFAYEQGGLDGDIQNDFEEQNLNAHMKKKENVENQSGGYTDQSYEVSREPIDFREKPEEMQLLQIITESKLLLDEVSGACVFTRKQQLPKMTVSILGEKKNEGESSGKPQKKYVELHICEKSRHSDNQKYRINKKGIVGRTRIRITKEKPATFQKIRFNYSSDKAARLIIILYQIGNDRVRKYKSVMVSNEINVLNEHKIMCIESGDHMKGYFEEEPQHIHLPENKASLNNKISTQISLQKISDEIRYFETYLTKKSKKNTNLLYIVNKYSDIIDLYFLSGNPQQNSEQRFKELWKQAHDEIKNGLKGDSERTCNYLHPEAKFILKINSPLPSVKIIIKKQFTKLLSIIASQECFDSCGGRWIKLESCASQTNKVQIAPKIDPPVIKPAQSQPQSVENNQHHHPSTPAGTKKHHGKAEDEQFHEEQSDEDEDDDGEYEGEQSQNDSVSNAKRRGRRIGQRKTATNDYKKNSHSNLRENKYATRNRTKANDEDEVHSKRLAVQKKAQEKEAMNLRQNSSQQSNLPFKILTPNQMSELPKNSSGQNQDNKMPVMNMGGMLFPMMNPNNMGGMGMKKPDDKSNSGTGMPPGLFYLGQQKAMPMPFMMPMNGTSNPQILQMGANGGMPNNIQMFPMGNGMQAVMVPMQLDKAQQSGMNGMNPMMGGIPMMFANPNSNGNSNNNSNSTNPNGMMGMPQGFMMPFPGMMDNKGGMPGMMGVQQQKPQEQNKNKPSMGSQTDMSKKDEKKSDTFPPAGMIDMSKMTYMGQMPGMGGGMPGMGMQIPQMMMPGSMSGQGGQMQMGGMFGMPGMNPMMAMQGQKPASQMKDQNKPMQMPMMMQGSGGLPFLMVSGNQMSPQNPQSGGQGQGMNMGMMNFPGFMPGMQQMQMPSQQTSSQSGSMSNQPSNGMPPGMMMQMNPQAMQNMMRGMPPDQQQQFMMQMKMMPGMFQMPKGDGNDPNKK